MRYFVRLGYNGREFVGWQVQPNGRSVQGVIQDALQLILRHSIDLVGCGRTDSGVHASLYYAHFETHHEHQPDWVHRLNQILPDQIAIYDIFPVKNDQHARYSATRRTYRYYISDHKDPFLFNQEYYCYDFKFLDTSIMQQAASLLLDYNAFFPFCKSKSDVSNYACTLFESDWKISENRMVFTISANRFLRGMVRLIVGMCLQTGRKKVTLEDVRRALDQQAPLEKSLSAPAHGLFLTNVHYPFVEKGPFQERT